MAEKSNEPSGEGRHIESVQQKSEDPIFLMEEARYQSRIFQGTEVFVNYWGYHLF